MVYLEKLSRDPISKQITKAKKNLKQFSEERAFVAADQWLDDAQELLTKRNQLLHSVPSALLSAGSEGEMRIRTVLIHFPRDREIV